MHVIIADINGKLAYSDFHLGEHEYSHFEITHLCEKIRDLLTNNGIKDFKISTAFDFEELNELIEGYDGKILIFSNFPPNISYKPHFVEIKYGKRLVRADGYMWTKLYFNKLLILSSRIELHIITGAPETKLPDFQIYALSQYQKITIQRKAEWLDSVNYHALYENYVLAKIEESIEKSRQKS